MNHHQKDWSSWSPIAEFCHNNSVNSATGHTPFEVVYEFHPRLSISKVELENPAADSRAELLQKIRNEVSVSLETACITYGKTNYTPPQFAIGDRVWLLATNLQTSRPARKLEHKRLGPYQVLEQVSPVAFRLALPRSLKIHNVFHTSLLSAYVPPTSAQTVATPPKPVTKDGEEEYEVEEVLDSRVFRGCLEYLVCCRGYGPEADSWENGLELTDGAAQVIADFHAAHPDTVSSVGQRPSRLCQRWL